MNHRILIIDDDERLCGMLQQYLGDAGYRVESRHTIASGLQALKQEAYDALVLDLMLPDGDGLDACRQLRGFSTIPVLMLTARGEAMDRILGLEMGADDSLPKPFEPRELLARLKAILRRGKAGSGDVLMFAWMNREALMLTWQKNEAVYWSRSRKKIWHKGEESGHIQKVKEIRLDCDADVILLQIEQQGGIACHTGRQSCFFTRLEYGQWHEVDEVLKSPDEIYKHNKDF